MLLKKPKILIICREKKIRSILKRIKYIEWIQDHELNDNDKKNILGIIIILNQKCLKNLNKIFGSYPNVPKYGIISPRLKKLKPSLLRMGFSEIEELPFEIEKLDRIITSLMWGKRSGGEKSFNIFTREMLAHALNTRNEKVVINKIGESMLRIFKADRVSIMQIDHSTNTLTIKSAVGIPDRVLRTSKRKLGEKIAGWVAEKNMPVLLQNGLVADDRFKDIKGNPKVKSSIIVPLTFANKTLGVINITRFKGTDFVPEEKDKAELYGSFIAMIMSQLEELERIDFLKRAVDHANEGIIVIDSESRILMLSRGAERMLGVHLDEVANRNLLEAVNLHIHRNALERIIRGRSISNLQINYTGVDNIQRVLLLSASSVTASDRTRFGAIIILRELTHFIELQRDKLNVDKLHELTLWIDEISHQMNNPLSVIMGNIHIINEDIKTLPEIKDKPDAVKYYDRLLNELKKMLSEINDASERINVFIKTLKNFQIDGEISWERCFLTDLIDRAIDIAGVENINNIKVVKRYTYNPIILCVRDKLISVLVTLIKNAIAQSIKEDKINITLRKGYKESVFEINLLNRYDMQEEKKQEGPMDAFYSTLDIPSGFRKGYGLIASVINMHHGKVGFELEKEKKLTIKLELPEHE